ncbi:MAG: isoleucine--tRNA ligase [Candidatus Latescibacterota bacterium]|nr:MAG: isoleucine--tRNA ligase [Candidatus Latescibacterota bacterium]
MDNKRFRTVATPASIPEVEKSIIEFWDRDETFEKSVSRREGKPRFVFYEGPPTANGRPGVHHVIARLSKDIVCRYKTMLGYQVIRKAGWDTHGLPVEIEVEKELGFRNKDQIEAFGIAEFNAKCRESVFKYKDEWTRFTKRIGYWLDLENPYVTYTNDYIETVWWILGQLWAKGLLYEGHKIVPYCPRCETSLSSHEVGLGYKDVSDPSIYIKFRAADADERFLVWTTTPWTLTANAALAVGADHDYVRVEHDGETLILAEARLSVLEGEYKIVEKIKGESLAGRKYEPLFPFFKDAENGFNVFAADFVSLEDGTGIVHIAPAFGEDDYQLHMEKGVPLLQPVTLQGTLSDDVEPWAGQWIKDADPKIIEALDDEGKLYQSGRIKHSYPFCWRCDTALIYYARRSWYIKTTAFKDDMIAANKKVNWIPSEVGEHRFGNWLENNVDWALSRERYWGTPLPVWRCKKGGHMLAVGSVEELRKLGKNIPEDDELDLHRPQVDGYELGCPECGGGMKRVPEVIDAWFDSGSMPFAQYHYPFETNGVFEEQFPADFISEGIDQSRGWFYSLLAISTFVKGESSYKNCVVTELILDKQGQKMSKSRKNTVEPWVVLDKEGADALRWYLITASPPWLPTRFDRKAVAESSQKLLGTLRNVYSFFAMYASLDDWRPDGDVGAPSLIDRWVLSRFHSTVVEVRKQLDVYDMTRAARALQTFVLDELSNWYVRRSRRRFWKGEMGPDKLAAYNTLYSVLRGTLRLLSPFVPFVTEEIEQALHHAMTGEPEGESVHLDTFPDYDREAIDGELESLMDTALRVCALGRTVRNETGIKIRQPLGEMRVYDEGGRCSALLEHEEISAVVRDELHIKRIEPADDVAKFVTMTAVPSYPALGKRFGKRVPDIVKGIEDLGQEELVEFQRSGEVTVGAGGGDAVRLGRDEMTVKVAGVAPYGAHQEHGITVALNLEIDETLRLEGIARELVNRLQNLRKKAGLEVSDRIVVRYHGGQTAKQVIDAQGEFIQSETLATSLDPGAVEWDNVVEYDVDGENIRLWIKRESD